MQLYYRIFLVQYHFESRLLLRITQEGKALPQGDITDFLCRNDSTAVQPK